MAAAKKATTNTDVKNDDVVIMGDDNKSYKKDSKKIEKVNKKEAKETTKEAKEAFGGKTPWYKKMCFWKKNK